MLSHAFLLPTFHVARFDNKLIKKSHNKFAGLVIRTHMIKSENLICQRSSLLKFHDQFFCYNNLLIPDQISDKIHKPLMKAFLLSTDYMSKVPMFGKNRQLSLKAIC